MRVDRRLAYEVVSRDVVGLADPVHPPDALLNTRWAPWQVVVDYYVGELKVHALAARVGRHEHTCASAESVLRVAPFADRHRPVDSDRADASASEYIEEHLLGGHELGEHHHLGRWIPFRSGDLAEQFQQVPRLGVDARPDRFV